MIAESITESVNNKLQECREDKSLTRDQVAKAVNINPKSLYRYEMNMACPKIDAALRLAKFYNKAVDELFYLDN